MDLMPTRVDRRHRGVMSEPFRTEAQAPKPLRRSRTDRKVAGVLGGIANYFNVDPTLVRVGYIILAFVTVGCALIAYPVLWFVMPEEQPAPV